VIKVHAINQRTNSVHALPANLKIIPMEALSGST